MDLSGYWGEHTATRDWCEQNYATSPYIAEFWNTISNLTYILFSLNLLRYKQKFTKITELKQFKSINIIIYSMFILGLSSGAFHATLKYWPQFMDRLFCLIPLIGFKIGFTEVGSDLNQAFNSTQISVLVIMSYFICSVIAVFIMFEVFTLYLAINNLYKGYIMTKQIRMKEIKSHSIKCLIYLIIGLIVWILDSLTCNFFLNNLGFIPHFHAQWHLFTAIAFHEIALVQMYLLLVKMKESPEFVSCKFLTIGIECDFGNNRNV